MKVFKIIMLLIATGLSGMLALGLLFRLQHYPGSGIMVGVGTLTFAFPYFPLLAIYSFYSFKEKEKWNLVMGVLLAPCLLVVASPIMTYAAPKSFVDKFTLLDYKLTTSNYEISETHQALLTLAIQQNEEKQAELNALHEATEKLLASINETKVRLAEVSGGYDPNTGRLIGEKDYDRAMAYLLGFNGESGRAYELEQEVKDYIELVNTNFPSLNIRNGITLASSEIPALESMQYERDFAYLNFDHVPTIGCMALLEQMRADILKIEQQILVNVLAP